jgi:hypothetical protein
VSKQTENRLQAGKLFWWLTGRNHKLRRVVERGRGEMV